MTAGEQNKVRATQRDKEDVKSHDTRRVLLKALTRPTDRQELAKTTANCHIASPLIACIVAKSYT